MRRIRKFFVLGVIFSLLILLSCGKKGDPYPKRPATAQIVEAKKTME